MPTSHASRWAGATGFASAVLAIALSAAPAPAHAILVESSPKEGEVLAAAPKEAVLRFNGRIEKSVMRATLTDGEGKKLKMPAPPRDKDGPPERLVVPLPPLAPGTYRLEYRVLAADGHATPGLLRFTISPPQTRPSGDAAK